MDKGYIIKKEQHNKEITYIEYEVKTGYDVSPKNKAKIKDSIDVSNVVFLYPIFIEKILKKKIEKKYKEVLSLVTKVASDDEDDDTGFLIGTRGEIERFRDILKTKYNKFLDQKKLEELVRKLDIMKKEITKKLDAYDYIDILENKNGKSR